MADLLTIGKDTLIFNKSDVKTDISKYENWIDKTFDYDEDPKEWGFKYTKTEIKQILDEIRKVVDILDINEIAKCIPTLKNGDFRRAPAPLYDSGLTHYEGEAGCWCRITNVELLVECVNSDKRIFEVTFSDNREHNKLDQFIYDGKYNKLEFKTNSYIKYEDLIPGCIYIDAKNNEFLCVGVVDETDTDVPTGRSIKTSTGTVLETKACTTRYTNVFVKLSKKVKKVLDTCDNFGDYYKTLTYDIYYEDSIKTSDCIKMTALVSTRFTPDKIFGEYTCDTRTIKVLDKKITREWTACANWWFDHNYHHDEFFTSMDKKAINQWVKDYKAKYPNVVDGSEEWWYRFSEDADKADFISIHVSDHLVAVDK